MTHRDALITKNYILAHQNINFADRNFFVRKGEKNFFKIGKWNSLKMPNMAQRDARNTKNYIFFHLKINFLDRSFSQKLR